MTPAESHATTIARRIIALARAMDGTTSELAKAHDDLMQACEESPTGPGWQWMAQQSIIETLRTLTIERTALSWGNVLIACEEARDAMRDREPV
jgi:hypothetical protein